MTSAERSDITNAIWLCSNCHKMVDDDVDRFPAGLLFEWQREHERRVSELVGKAGAELRERYEQRHLQELGQLSYLAERLVIEKGDLWEYRLTAEMLRFEMAETLRRWSALKRGLYMKQNTIVSKDAFASWMQAKLAEMSQITHAFGVLANSEFHRAWGESGVAGDDKAIIATCRLYAGMCASALEWEEAVRFTKTDEVFEEARALFEGVAGRMIDEATKLPSFIAGILEADQLSGTFKLDLTLDLPEDWSESISAALDKATHAFIDS